MGCWAQRKWDSALDRQLRARVDLQELGVLLAELERKWDAQVKAQLVSTPHKQ